MKNHWLDGTEDNFPLPATGLTAGPPKNKHYRYGGSTAGRTIHCPGWRALADTVPEPPTSVYADRGSMLHLACEILLREHITFDGLLERGIEFNGIKLTEELLKTKVIPAVEELDKLRNQYGIQVHDLIPEEILEINELVGGTIDISALAKKVYLFVDYKFGEGIMVYAEDNDQLLFYAWVKIANTDFVSSLSHHKKVILAIIQPADKREEYLDIWEVTVGRILKFGNDFMAAVDVAEASKPGENLNTGSHCRFCPAAAICPKKLAEGNAALKLLDTSVLKKLDTMELNDLAVQNAFNMMDLKTALAIASKLEPWIKQVRSFAINQLARGAEDLGYKMVLKRRTRKYVNKEKVTKYLKRKLGAYVAIKRELISPAQAEKEAKRLGIKLNMENRVFSESSGTTLVPDSDKREAVVSQKEIADTLKTLDMLGEK